MLLREVEIRGCRADVRLAGGRVTEVGQAGTLRPLPGEEAVDGAGGALLPGLTDHHVHLFAWAAALTSVACGPPAVRDAHALREALATASGDAAGWVRGVGYAESVAGPLDARALDLLHPRRPVRLQHRGGSMWMLNTAAIRLLGLDSLRDPGIERGQDGTPTGRLWRADHLLRTARTPPDLRPLAAALARWGVTSVTDATPALDPVATAALAAQLEGGALPQRVRLLGAPEETVGDRLTSGPWKIVIRDDALPDLAGLAAEIQNVHALDRPVALHCLTMEALLLALAAFDEVGSLDGDRIEHAAVVPDWCLDRLRRHGLRVVTQPAFLADRGEDMLSGMLSEERDDLYRYGGLLRAGVPTVASSDAPYGPADPWQVIAAARDRTTETGRPVTPAERVPAEVALDGYLTPGHLPRSGPCTVRPGAAADLVLLDCPLRDVLREPHADRVRMTVIDGRAVHRAR
ncbi:amidohydrolase family protein [Acrocarpospora catenulata]|uniref:amidohydrolase family protein n=1 Tax=Acrocarpospora catenulata TaxID=2836182 RepID=UPI001BDA595C|nr:amidohydrolase family protein [Acrocarpospora catenulata]